jgi:N-acetyldiaminopimelate deacetylase
LPTGQIATRQGTLFAGTTEIHLHITGRGGHAAYPHEANDALVAAAYFVTNVQTIVSRNVDPIRGGVVTIGSLNAGTAGNIIAGEAELHGTIRALRQVDIEMMQQRVRDMVAGLETMFNIKADLRLFQGGYKPVENNDDTTVAFMSYAESAQAVDFAEIAPAMTGEDFGTILQSFPGTMFWLGVGDPKHSLHESGLNPDEAALPKAVQTMIGYLTERMGE